MFLAAYIPSLNVSKHVKLPFVTIPGRFELPKNLVELALGGTLSLKPGKAQSGQDSSTVSCSCGAWLGRSPQQQV